VKSAPRISTVLNGVRKPTVKVPSGISLEVAENSLAGATCYRKLVLQSRETDKVAYRFELFASPDMRFLSKELMDMTLSILLWRSAERWWPSILACLLRARRRKAESTPQS
jgi:hypothetical protein